MYPGLILSVFDALCVVFPTDRVKYEDRRVARAPGGLCKTGYKITAFGAMKCNVAGQGVLEECFLFGDEFIFGGHHRFENPRLEVVGEAELLGVAARRCDIRNELASAVARHMFVRVGE